MAWQTIVVTVKAALAQPSAPLAQMRNSVKWRMAWRRNCNGGWRGVKWRGVFSSVAVKLKNGVAWASVASAALISASENGGGINPKTVETAAKTQRNVTDQRQPSKDGRRQP